MLKVYMVEYFYRKPSKHFSPWLHLFCEIGAESEKEAKRIFYKNHPYSYIKTISIKRRILKK